MLKPLEKRLQEIENLCETEQTGSFYFGKTVDKAIILYNELVFSGSFCPKPKYIKEKNFLYTMAIYPAFDKLAEYLINIYKFYQFGPIEDIKHDLTCFLFETMPKYDNKKGSKAFSWFNIIAKNYLIQLYYKHKDKMYKEVEIGDLPFNADYYHNFISPDEIDENLEQKYKDDNNERLFPHTDFSSINEKENISEFFSIIKTKLHCWKNKTKNKKEKKVIDALIIIFGSNFLLDVQNQKAIMFYIAEITGLKYSEIRFAMTKIRKRFRFLKKKYFNGEI